MSQIDISQLHVVFMVGGRWSSDSLLTDAVFTSKEEAQKHLDDFIESCKTSTHPHLGVEMKYGICSLDDWFSTIRDDARREGAAEERGDDIR